MNQRSSWVASSCCWAIWWGVTPAPWELPARPEYTSMIHGAARVPSTVPAKSSAIDTVVIARDATGSASSTDFTNSGTSVAVRIPPRSSS